MNRGPQKKRSQIRVGRRGSKEKMAPSLGVSGVSTSKVGASKQMRKGAKKYSGRPPASKRTGARRAKPRVTKSAVELLQEETAKMEDRLKMLRGQMAREKEHWATVQRTADGCLWESARPSKNYSADVMKKVSKKNQRYAARQAAKPRLRSRPGSRPGSATGRRPGVKNVKPASKSSYTAAKKSNPQAEAAIRNLRNQLVKAVEQENFLEAARLKEEINKVTLSAGIKPKRGQKVDLPRKTSSSLTATGTATTTTTNSTTAKARPTSLLSGTYDEGANRREFQKAREEWLRGASADSAQKTTIVRTSTSSTATATATISASPAASSAADASLAGPGSLLAGGFDEAAGHAGFAAARKQWLGAGGDENAPKVEIVRLPPSTTAIAATSITQAPDQSNQNTSTGPRTIMPSAKALAAVKAQKTSSSSLLEGAFDEKLSHDAFAAAREDWIGTTKLDLSKASSGNSGVPLSHWNVALAQSELDKKYGIAAASASTATSGPVSTKLAREFESHERKAKMSCYQCYKLFYADKACSLGTKNFCTKTCLDLFHQSERIKCSRRGCPNRFPRSAGVLKNDTYQCQDCASGKPIEYGLMSNTNNENQAPASSANNTSNTQGTPKKSLQVANTKANVTSTQVNATPPRAPSSQGPHTPPTASSAAQSSIPPKPQSPAVSSILEWQQRLVVRPSTPQLPVAADGPLPQAIVEFPDD